LFKTIASIVVLGAPALLCLGLACDIVSPREWASGLLAWFATIIVWIIVRKLAKKPLAPSAEGAMELDEHSRRRILRELWLRKAWIGILAILLPVGIWNGVAHRAWIPTLSGVGISLSLMYVAAREIRRRREQISQTR